MMKIISHETGHHKQVDWLLIIPIFLLIFSMISCSAEDHIEIHPQEPNLPHASNLDEAIPIDTLSTITMQSNQLPPVVSKLHDYLLNPSGHEVLELSILENAFGTRFAWWSGRLVVLHIASDYLVEINLDSGEYTRLADVGNGPGDIRFAYNLTQSGQHLYVVCQDMRLSIFDCSMEPCEFEREIPLEQSGLSAAVNQREQIAIMSQRPFMGGGEETFSENSILLYDREGQVTDTFAPAYRTRNWVLQDMYLRGDVLFNQSLGRYLVHYDHLPYLYLYNQDLSLDHIYQIRPFRQSIIEYDRQTGSRNVTTRSIFSDVTKVGDQGYIITISHNHNRSEDDEMVYHRIYDYYYLDLSGRGTWYIGSLEHEGTESLALLVYPEGIIVNDGGVLQIIQAM